MNNRQLRQYEMLVRVRDFGTAHKDRFPESTVATQTFAAVAAAVAQLREYAVAQLALKREGARARAAAPAALLDIVEAISRTARVIQAEEPSFPNSFHMPERRSAQALLTSARLCARDIEPVAEKFIAHAMPKTFVADLSRLLDVYEEAVRGRETDKGENAAARASIEAAVASGLAAARTLDVIIANQSADDVVMVAEWERDRVIGPRKRGSNTATPPAPPPAPPVVVPTAA